MIRRYTENDLEGVKRIALDNAKDILLNIEEIVDINVGRVLVFDNGAICGFAFFQPYNFGRRLDLCIVVDNEWRRQRIGTRLYTALLDDISAQKYDPESYECKMVKGELPSLLFATKLGYNNWINYHIMYYNDEFLPTPSVIFAPYEDKYFQQYFALLGRAFYDLRKSLDTRPHKMVPGSRDSVSPEETFLAINTQDEPIAAVTITGNHIDDVAVSPEVQGLGFGRQLAMFATNKALMSSAGFAVLDVIESNSKAVNLYTSLGYKTAKTIAVMRQWL